MIQRTGGSSSCVFKGGIMRKIIILFIAGIISLAMLAACNKESEDNSMLALLGVGAHEGSFVKEVIGSEGTVEGTVAMWNIAPYIRYMILYSSSDINGSGMISSISFKYNGTQEGGSFHNVTIKMGHTGVSTLSDVFANNIEIAGGGKGSFETVLDNETVAIPGGNDGEYFTVYLSRPFNYNGIDNLVVEINRNATSDNPQSINCQKHIEDNINIFSVYSFVSANTTGSTSFSYPDVKLNFAGGDNIAVVVNSSDLEYYSPFGPNVDGLKVQQLHLASEINGSGLITGIAVPVADTATAAETYTITVKLGHTNRNELATAFADNFNVGSPVSVAQGVAFNVPAGIPEGTYVWLPLPDRTFSYNGKDNLVVEIQSAATETGTLDMQTASVAHRRLWGSLTASTGIYSNRITGIKFRFAGGTMDVITGGGAGNFTGYVFNTSASGRLNLYRAVELGSAGTIRSIFCRLYDASSTATSYGNYRVIIGHSDVDSLILDPAADNFVSQKTVLNGTVSVPAGLVQGDWIEIPLSSPFVYDGKSNLAVWLGTTDVSGAAVTHNCIRSPADAAQYDDHMTQGLPGAATVSTPQDYKLNMMFKISR